MGHGATEDGRLSNWQVLTSLRHESYCRGKTLKSRWPVAVDPWRLGRATVVERKLREVKTSATHNVGSYFGDAPAVHVALGAARSD